MTEKSQYILPLNKNISLSCSVCNGLGIIVAMTHLQRPVHVVDNHLLVRLVC